MTAQEDKFLSYAHYVVNDLYRWKRT